MRIFRPVCLSGTLTTGVSSGDQFSVDEQWQKYFKDPTQWWDNRKNKVHPSSPDFRHKSNRVALWLDTASTPKWVIQAFQRKMVPKNAVHVDGGGECTAQDAPDFKLHQGDSYSRTSLIRQYAKCGQGKHALEIYREMRKDGVKPSSYTFVAALKACSSLKDLDTAKDIHMDIVDNGFELDRFVGTTLVDVYAKCGSLIDATRVFEKMPCRDVVSWNAMILGYAQLQEGAKALQLYTRMQQAGIQPNDRTFVGALKACSNLALSEGSKEAGVKSVKRSLDQVRVVHSDILKNGSESNVFLGNMLVDVYAKCGSIVDSRRVFETMHHRDLVAWNAMILGYAGMDEGEVALQLYKRMQQEGLVPDDQTFVGALKACSSLTASEEADGNRLKKRWLEQVGAIHSDILKRGCESNMIVANLLVDVYAKCGSLVDARHVFDMMPRRNVVSWTTMILAHAQMGEGEVGCQLYSGMQQEGVVPDERAFVCALKACSSALEEGTKDDMVQVRKRCLDRVRAIHSDIEIQKMELDVYLGTMLVDVYAKCGSLVDARRVFEKMPYRNLVAWNAIILRYAQVEEGATALQLYARMQQEGLVPNERTYVGVLKACSSITGVLEGDGFAGKDEKKSRLGQVSSIHSDIVRGGSESDVYVGNMLVNMYAKAGSLADARTVFEKMPCRDVVAWNAMIFGYAQTNSGKVSLELYTRMKQDGVAPNDRTFVAALKACSSIAALDDRKGAAGACSEAKQCLEQVKDIHLDVVKSGCEKNVFVANMLVDAYAKCGSLIDARNIFEVAHERNVVSWTAMMSAYTNCEEGETALDLYSRMKEEGVAPDVRAFIAALRACSNIASVEEVTKGDGLPVKVRCLEKVRAIHSEIVEGQFELDVFVGTMLVDLYAKCGSLADSRRVFDKMPCRDVAAWNAMIMGYANMGEDEEALQLYSQMKEDGVKPDDRTFLGALKACSRLAELDEGNKLDGKRVKERCLGQVRAVHSDVVNSGCQSHLIVTNVLVDVYAKCRSLVDARQVFEAMPHRDVVSWNVMILGYVQMDEGEEALQLYIRMQQEGVPPNERTLIGALQACGRTAELEKGMDIHARFSDLGLEDKDLFVSNALIDMYGKCGSMVDARQVFDALSTKDVVTWSALIAGYARQGESAVVFDLFHKMLDAGIQPNGITFLSVLTVCSHAGLVDKGKEYFLTMSKNYGIAPTVEHYICMVDLLGRVGQLDEAMKMVTTMPFQADGVVWRCILGACRKWRNVELGRQAFEAAVSLDTNDAAAYVLMSNIYAAAHMWEDAKELQAKRRKIQAWKQPGQSWWTDLGGVLHAFMVGYKEHPKIRDIRSKLRELYARMKKEGYVPHLDSVLRDIPDPKKEEALCGHSEKLAIAYALLETPDGTTIRVVKNLRVCEDCHAATAFISKIERRTIICRDASRFHVFKDGSCSCKDYW